MKNKGDGQNVMRCRVEFDRKKWRVSLERRDQDSWEKSEHDVDLMDGCSGVVEILQQRPSLLLSSVHLILQILQIEINF